VFTIPSQSSDGNNGNGSDTGIENGDEDGDTDTGNETHTLSMSAAHNGSPVEVIFEVRDDSGALVHEDVASSTSVTLPAGVYEVFA
ncbi:hypothetical protein ACKC5Q_23240, partial [Aeromonas dhakensis]|uniref:hypothetical protein n=1 Tax=Aeromonas dhakensis TaxID=196024 RepID=UPI0038B4CDB0